LDLDDWIKYEGTFTKNLKEGIGYLTFKNGDIFLGEFKENQAEGLGIYYKSNGEKIIGVWKGNTFENKLEWYIIPYIINIRRIEFLMIKSY